MTKQEAEELRILHDKILYLDKLDEYKHELAKRNFIRRQIELSKYKVQQSQSLMRHWII